LFGTEHSLSHPHLLVTIDLMSKMRLDILLVERGLAESRSQAQRLVMAGQVRVNGQVVDKPAAAVLDTVDLHIDRGPRYVSRGGEKLESALQIFEIDVSGLVCADVGASTGGFSDCLLQNGAVRVYAIDVGQGILDWRLRQDERVVVMEGVNARHLDQMPEPVDFVTIDASFISLKILFPVVIRWFGEKGGRVIALIKPQFEAGRSQVSKGKGVVRDPVVHRQVVLDVLSAAQKEGFDVLGLARSPLLGPKGNTEFLALLQFPTSVSCLEKEENQMQLEEFANAVGLVESEDTG
jgi:23S rRNA (cytidine1920-2'-O)/16S rRNA (cytidine1409-2'-O)-methyltransferase